DLETGAKTGTRHHLVDGPGGEHAALAQQDHVIRIGDGEIEIVNGGENADPVTGETARDVEHHALMAQIERGSGFVEQQVARQGSGAARTAPDLRDGARELDALLLAARKR